MIRPEAEEVSELEIHVRSLAESIPKGEDAKEEEMGGRGRGLGADLRAAVYGEWRGSLHGRQSRCDQRAGIRMCNTKGAKGKACPRGTDK